MGMVAVIIGSMTGRVTTITDLAVGRGQGHYSGFLSFVVLWIAVTVNIIVICIHSSCMVFSILASAMPVWIRWALHRVVGFCLGFQFG